MPVSSRGLSRRASRGLKPFFAAGGDLGNDRFQGIRTACRCFYMDAEFTLIERAQPGDFAADDEGIDVMRALVGDDRFEVAQVAHYVVVLQDAVATEDLACGRRHLTGHRGAAQLGVRRHTGRGHSLVQQPTKLYHEELGLGDLTEHAHEFGLDELKGGDWLAELFAAQRVGKCYLVAGNRFADGVPGNVVPGDSEDLGHGPEASLRQSVRRWNATAVEPDVSLPDAPLRQLPFDDRRCEAGAGWFNQEAGDPVFGSCPDDRDIADRRVADPALASLENVVVAVTDGTRRQA